MLTKLFICALLVATTSAEQQQQQQNPQNRRQYYQQQQAPQQQSNNNYNDDDDGQYQQQQPQQNYQSQPQQQQNYQPQAQARQPVKQVQVQVQAQPKQTFQPQQEYQPRQHHETTTYIPIIRFDKEQGNDGSYKAAWETGNNIIAQEEGYLKSLGPNPDEPTEELNAQVQQGSYSYTSPEGQLISVQYTADEFGFHPTGDHLPTPPPVSPEVQKGLDLIYAGIKQQQELAAREAQNPSKQQQQQQQQNSQIPQNHNGQYRQQ